MTKIWPQIQEKTVTTRSKWRQGTYQAATGDHGQQHRIWNPAATQATLLVYYAPPEGMKPPSLPQFESPYKQNQGSHSP